MLTPRSRSPAPATRSESASWPRSTRSGRTSAAARSSSTTTTIGGREGRGGQRAERLGGRLPPAPGGGSRPREGGRAQVAARRGQRGAEEARRRAVHAPRARERVPPGGAVGTGSGRRESGDLRLARHPLDRG